jgi:hypothetical protein
LAFLLIGGISGASAWIFYPGQSNGSNQGKLLVVGFLAAVASSYIGQFAGLFQSGQMLEWLSAIVASCLAGSIYAGLVQ